MEPLHWRDRKSAAFGQRTTAIDIIWLIADPGIIQKPRDPLFLRELAEITHHFLYKQAARFFIRRACFTVVGEPPFRNPAGFAAQRAYRIDQPLQAAQPVDCGSLLARAIAPGIGVKVVGIYEFVQTIGAKERYGRAHADPVILLRRRPGAFLHDIPGLWEAAAYAG